MTTVVASVDVSRPPETVFPYVTDPARFGEWQAGVLGGGTDGEPGVGTTCSITRRIGGAERTSTAEITELSPPERWVIRGIDGHIRASVEVSVQPAGDGQHSKVTVSLGFSGRGIGRLLVPLAVRQARREVPRSCRELKARLEAASAGPQEAVAAASSASQSANASVPAKT